MRQEAGQAGQATLLGDRPVAEIMSRALVIVRPDESVLLAWELLRRSGFHHLPVVGRQGHCVGLLSRTELALACAHCSLLDPPAVNALIRLGHNPRVESGDTVRRAADAMTTHGVDGLPVVDEHGALVGLVTARDMVAALAGRSEPDVRATETDPTLFRMEPAIPPHRSWA
jgi:CBS domain-containing protein